jgi:tetratricopeptide (TPR) repeat protein
MPSALEASTFVAEVRPHLEHNDLAGLVALLRERWDVPKLEAMLLRPDADARKVALVCLSLVSTPATIPVIAAQLVSTDATVNSLAEHALWSIWFRAGSPEANQELCRGARQLAARNFDCAIEHLDRAIAISPGFAEAFNQRAIVRFMREEYELSIGDCRRAVRLMPCHFGAWAGMGHCFLHLGQLDHALRAYERALAVNPHLTTVAQAANEIRAKLAARGNC